MKTRILILIICLFFGTFSLYRFCSHSSRSAVANNDSQVLPIEGDWDENECDTRVNGDCDPIEEELGKMMSDLTRRLGIALEEYSEGHCSGLYIDNYSRAVLLLPTIIPDGPDEEYIERHSIGLYVVDVESGEILIRPREEVVIESGSIVVEHFYLTGDHYSIADGVAAYEVRTSERTFSRGTPYSGERTYLFAVSGDGVDCVLEGFQTMSDTNEWLTEGNVCNNVLSSQIEVAEWDTCTYRDLIVKTHGEHTIFYENGEQEETMTTFNESLLTFRQGKYVEAEDWPEASSDGKNSNRLK